ncbi:MAG TPA: zinc ribbon domain-containing protein [Steroidobacteraceae bacterium]|jgi:putative FmdB family regulatory protein
MPFYEYECQACKYYAEVMQKISDAPLTRCPSCGKRALKKLLSVPVFRLKGSGWYETDFKSDKENRRNLHGTEKEEAKAETKTEAKEAKPAAAETKESKEAKPAAAKSSTGAAAGAGASRSRTMAARSTATRRSTRAAHKGRARKPRR